MNHSDYSPDECMGKTYTCPECGMRFKTRFKDSKVCLFCTKEEQHEIADKLGTLQKLRYK